MNTICVSRSNSLDFTTLHWWNFITVSLTTGSPSGLPIISATSSTSGTGLHGMYRFYTRYTYIVEGGSCHKMFQAKFSLGTKLSVWKYHKSLVLRMVIILRVSPLNFPIVNFLPKTWYPPTKGKVFLPKFFLLPDDLSGYLSTGPTVWVDLLMVLVSSSSPESLRSVPGTLLYVAAMILLCVAAWKVHSWGLMAWSYVVHVILTGWDVMMSSVSWSSLPSPLCCLLNLSLSSSTPWKMMNLVLLFTSQTLDLPHCIP